MFGKISILAKLKGWSKLRNIADQFYLEVMSVDRASSIKKGHAYDFSEKQQKKGKKRAKHLKIWAKMYKI